ncbi:MAG TPA: uroporphyrinogen decarboxylase family protein [Candidatus Latescibacteria bacterium]|jgi:uroporphyrinogen decarboxylase|nr:uroporphyrinogen decarboxylase family protein [Candidatus Latescibacterota bacterium]HJP32939.1 uroporphyrinogen decarboxylase family protein [Candidatus Latescibacterota bacterium]
MMTSRERVLATLARQQPDRVPIDYSANPGIDARLKQHFGLKADDTEGLRRALGVDFRGVGPAFVGKKLHADVPDRRVDPVWGRRTRWIEHDSGSYWDFCDFPLSTATEADIAAWPSPSADDYDYDTFAADIKRRQQDEVAIFYGSPGVGDIINSNGMIRSMEQVLVDLATDDPAGLMLIDRKVEHELELMRRCLEIGGDGIDFVWLGEDLGTQRGPLLSLDMYRRQIRPRHARYVDLATEFGKPVMIHTCGSSSWAYDDFIDMGISAVDTLQPEAHDMSPAHLKSRYGDGLAFHGCISTAGPVAYGTVDEVVAVCRETLETMMPGGGYCFAPTHQLQDNSPTENVLAMYDSAIQYGAYD